MPVKRTFELLALVLTVHTGYVLLTCGTVRVAPQYIPRREMIRSSLESVSLHSYPSHVPDVFSVLTICRLLFDLITGFRVDL